MFTLFIFGTLWFWVLVSVACIILTVAVEHGHSGWATLSVLATLSLLSFFGDINVFRFAALHPIATLECAVAYVCVGAAWSVAKWYFYVRAARERFDEAKDQWFRIQRPYRAPDRRFTEFRLKAQVEYDNAMPGNDALQAKSKLDVALLNENNAKFLAETNLHNEFKVYAKDFLIPSVRREKGKIITWMCFWPWSASWTLVNDPIKRVFTVVYNKLRGLFEGIVKHAFKGIDLEENNA